ncbi:type I protein arginine methyltransferase [Malassezia vespertilionis]|uniref:type I protein arginine methyltransferase n=1 Tax=Malassezia vespertilionis TaxID=2020962 RepID=UPI0024B0F7CE|nr:type I protein arginine methyltransferase [Malassezia vespertilionis]WFD05901.1 type I protein arginine methyltransferase [Malassezia vespertilionis]
MTRAQAEKEETLYDRKDEAYFSYYSMLTHQAQMLQDAVRTSTYQNAIVLHPSSFEDKVVMDVGAGNGILSLFAIQAGAKVVYAVEAAGVVACLHRLVDAAAPEDDDAPNAWVRDKLAIVHSRIEDVTPQKLTASLPKKIQAEEGKVDTLVSECLGVLLVHERMCESYIDARDRFLRPEGAMFPRTGSLCFSLLSDARLWSEVHARGEWWNTENFYGVNLTPFLDASRKEAFMSPVIGCFSPSHVVGARTDPVTAAYMCPDDVVSRYLVDFSSISMEELREFDVPVAWDCVEEPVVVHGLGAWFDLSFLQAGEEYKNDTNGTMTTSPFAPATHWAQVRMLFTEPLALNRGQRVLGTLHFKVNESRSYDIQGTFHVPLDDGLPLFTRTAFWKLDKQTYSWETTGPV